VVIFIIDKKNIVQLIMTIFGIFLIVFFMFVAINNSKNCCPCGVVNNGCCPCPNDKWFHTVEDWYGSEASSAGSWLYMCEEYQRANNVTFNCFE